MNRVIHLVIVFCLVSVISSYDSYNDSELTHNENDVKDIYQNGSDDAENDNKDTEDKNRLKSNELLEKALDLLHESRDRIEVRNAYNLLEESAKLDNLRAKELMAKSYLFGDGLPLDAGKALNILEGIGVNQSWRAHIYLGFMYSIGLGVNRSADKSIFHYKLAANQSSPLAKIAIAFRYNHGLGLHKSCRKALQLYQSVASGVVEDSKNFGGNPIVGRHLWQIKDTSDKNSNTIDSDLVDYYRFIAKGGDIKAQVSLGQLYYYGGNGIQRDRKRALNYFQKAAESGNPNALAFLGKYHLEGSPPFQQNFVKAIELFSESAKKGNPIGLTELGLMYRYGKGVEVNYEEAFKYFAQSARQGWVEAILQLGNLYLHGLGVHRDYRKAVKFFTLASQSKHLLAIYNLGQLHAGGMGVMRSCPDALSSLKMVAERGVWSEIFDEAYDDYKNGLWSQAFLKFAFLSEFGYELAQSNTAFIGENNDISALTPYLDIGPALPFKYWKASGAQGSSFARIKVGDYYYYGLGTPVDYRMSALYYRRASEHRYSGQALFNLGYLSERGEGVHKNYKMAKIYYDMCAQVDSDAKIAVYLAKLKLRAKQIIQTFVDTINLRPHFGRSWDLVLIAVLAIILSIVLCLR